jgi:DNA polymerase III subunit beta
MKLTCKQADLARGLNTVSHAVSTRSSMPLLTNVAVNADGESLRFSGTNLDIAITCKIPAVIEEGGRTAIPARQITEFANTLPTGDVKLSLAAGADQGLKVAGQRASATFRGMDASEFPAIPTAGDVEPLVTMQAKTLGEMINHTAFAAATDNARPVFTGVLARVRGDMLTLAAADSFRLAVCAHALRDDGESAGSATDLLIPAKSLIELAKVLPETGLVRVYSLANDTRVLFATEDVELISNLLAGKFPDFEAILPKSSTTTAAIKREDFATAAKRAAIFARDAANVVRLKIVENAAIIEASAAEGGDTSTTLDEGVAISGPQVEIMFNVKYLTDVLAVLPAEQVALSLNTARQPGLIRPEGESSFEYNYVIMPMSPPSA